MTEDTIRIIAKVDIPPEEVEVDTLRVVEVDIRQEVAVDMLTLDMDLVAVDTTTVVMADKDLGDKDLVDNPRATVKDTVSRNTSTADRTVVDMTKAMVVVDTPVMGGSMASSLEGNLELTNSRHQVSFKTTRTLVMDSAVDSHRVVVEVDHTLLLFTLTVASSLVLDMVKDKDKVTLMLAKLI